MAKRYDFAVDNNNDILIQNGDFSIVPSDDQHIQDAINFTPGSLKEFPFMGVGLSQFNKSSGLGQTIQRLCQQCLQADGYDIVPIVKYNSKGNVLITIP